MPKLEPVTNESGEVTGYIFECPGCGETHQVTVEPYHAENGASWTFNNDLEKPTFKPSVVTRLDFQPEANKPSKLCHLYIMNGSIHYLFDCTHSLAGEIVEMPEIEP